MLSLVAAAIIVALGFGNVSYAADEKTENTFGASFSTKVLSRYVGDCGAVYHNDWVSQHELTITHNPSGLYLDFWGGASLKNPGFKSNYGNEFDFTVGRSWEMHGLTVDAGVAYFDLVDVFSGSMAGDVVQPYVQLGKDFKVAENHTLTPSIKIEYAIPAVGNDPGLRGLHIHFALKHIAELSSVFSVSQELIGSYDDGAYGYNQAAIVAYRVAPSVRLSEKFSLNGSVLAIGPLTKVNDGRETEVVYSLGLSTTF